MVAEPVGQPAGVCHKDEPSDAGRASAMADGGLSGELRLRPPFDEERKRGLDGGLIDPGAPPPQEVSAASRPRTGVNR